MGMQAAVRQCTLPPFMEPAMPQAGMRGERRLRKSAGRIPKAVPGSAGPWRPWHRLLAPPAPVPAGPAAASGRRPCAAHRPTLASGGPMRLGRRPCAAHRPAQRAAACAPGAAGGSVGPKSLGRRPFAVCPPSQLHPEEEDWEEDEEKEDLRYPSTCRGSPCRQPRYQVRWDSLCCSPEISERLWQRHARWAAARRT